MSLSLPDLCDQHSDQLEVLDPVFEDFGGRRKFHGPIVTVKCYEDNSVVKQTLAEPGEGRVLVVDGGGSNNCALLGDMLAAMAAENGWQGVLVNGCVRDVEILGGIDLGVRALHAHPVKSEKRGRGQRDVPVHFADAEFRPGQHLYADPNGIAVAPRDLGVDF
jgi:regulator of ribonuclease activity A